MNLHGWHLLLAALGTLALISSSLGALSPAAATDEAMDEENSPVGFERYQSIIDRMPFGEPPPGLDVTLPPGSAAARQASQALEGEMTPEQRTQEEQKLAASVRVSVLNLTPAGRTMVGFTDTSAQPPEHFYLPVGGSKNDWEVKAADPATEQVTLVHAGIEVTVKLGEGNPGGDNGKAGARPRGSLMRANRLARAPMAASAPAAPGSHGGGAMARLRARRMQQQQEEAQRRRAAAEETRKEEERRAAEAEQAAAEREQQRNALLQIQEELRRAREEKEKAAQAATENAAESAPQE